MLRATLAAATRLPRSTLALLVLLAIGGAAVGVLVPVDGRLDRLAPSGSSAERAGATERASFGGDAALIVVRGDMVNTLLSGSDALRLGGLEGCLAGQVAPDAKGGPCVRIKNLKAVAGVDGPITYVNTALAQLGDAVTQRAAELKASALQVQQEAEALAKQKGLSAAEITQAGKTAASVATLQGYAQLGQYAKSIGVDEGVLSATLLDRAFVKQVLFAKGADGKLGPKRRLAAYLPNRQTALIQVRLVGDLSAGKRAAVTKALQAALAAKPFQLVDTKATYEFTGLAPATQTLSDAIRRSALALGAAALLVMACVLLLARRLRRRLLPVLVAAAVLGVALMALALPTGALSLAVVVALPVLVGLSVDQAVQAQLRLERRVHPDALRTLVIAGAAAAASALALAASPFAVVRTVGIALAAAILVSIVVAAAASAAAIAIGRRRAAGSGGERSAISAAAHDADELLAASRPVRGGAALGRGLGALAARTNRRGAVAVLAAGLALAVGGAALGSQTKVETNLGSLVPASSSGARALERLRQQTGASSSVSLVVRTKAVGSPALWRYLVAAQRTVTGGGTGRCDGRGLCTPLSLDDLFGTKASGALPTDTQISSVLAALPQAISRTLIDPDRGVIALPFGIGTLDGPAQRTLVASLERIASAAPSGSQVAVSGLPAVVAASAQALESPRRRAALALLAIGLPALVLLALLRSVRRTVVALVPPLFALGWSEAAMWALGVPRTPLTAALGVLVAAVAVEFSVLLGERYAALRRVGLDQGRAIATTLRETGGAVAISAGATIAGFAILGIASIPVISEFGIATAVDLALVLLALVAVGPATWVLAERRPARERRAAGEPATAR